MTVGFEGFNRKLLTFAVDSEIEAGTLVLPAAGGKIIPCESGDDFMGVVVACDGSYATVCVSGVVEVGCTDDSIGPGPCTLTVDDDGNVEGGNSSIVRMVLDVDLTAGKATIIL